MDREITITVTDEEARRIEERVAAGEFGSAADYVHAAVATALAGTAADIPDELLRQLLAEDEADPRPDLDADEVFAELHRYIDELAAGRHDKP